MGHILTPKSESALPQRAATPQLVRGQSQSSITRPYGAMVQQMRTKIPTQHDTYIQNPAEITNVRAITSGPSERRCYICRGKSLHGIEDRLPHTLSVAAVLNLSFSAGGAIASAPSLQRKTASSACRHPGRAPWIGVSPACQAVTSRVARAVLSCGKIQQRKSCFAHQRPPITGATQGGFASHVRSK